MAVTLGKPQIRIALRFLFRENLDYIPLVRKLVSDVLAVMRFSAEIHLSFGTYC